MQCFGLDIFKKWEKVIVIQSYAIVMKLWQLDSLLLSQDPNHLGNHRKRSNCLRIGRSKFLSWEKMTCVGSRGFSRQTSLEFLLPGGIAYQGKVTSLPLPYTHAHTLHPYTKAAARRVRTRARAHTHTHTHTHTRSDTHIHALWIEPTLSGCCFPAMVTSLGLASSILTRDFLV